jgi:polyisoprenoid-binding protein YceI
MKMKFTLIAAGLAVSPFAYVALHPGPSYAKPRMAAGAPTSMTREANYTLDPMHASIYFVITHLGLSQVHGRLDKFSGKIRENEKDLADSSVQFTAQVDSIDTNVAPRDTHLKSADFFDVAKYPELTFKSTRVAKRRGGYVVTGDLTIKDKTKSIAIPFKHYGPYSMKNVPDQPARIGIVADPIVIKRSDFGVGSTDKLPDGTMGASDEVVVRISLEATLDK